MLFSSYVFFKKPPKSVLPAPSPPVLDGQGRGERAQRVEWADFVVHLFSAARLPTARPTLQPCTLGFLPNYCGLPPALSIAKVTKTIHYSGNQMLATKLLATLFAILIISCLAPVWTYAQHPGVSPRNEAEELNMKGQEMFDRGLVAEALNYFERALELEPDYVDAMVHLANALDDLDRGKEALLIYEKALTLDPCFPETHYNYGLALQRDEQYQEAMQHYRKAVELMPDFAEAWNNLGQVLVKLGDDVGAIAAYKKSISVDSKYHFADTHLGAWLTTLDRQPEAVALLQKAIQVRPDYSAAHHNLGMALRAGGDLQGAVDRFRYALALDDQYLDARYELASVLLKQNKIDLAIEEFGVILERFPGAFGALSDIGLAHAMKADYSTAISYYQRALEINPDHPIINFNYGNALFLGGDKLGAIEKYKLTLSLDPFHAEALGNMGLAIREDDDDAVAIYEKLVEELPDNPMALSELGTYYAEAQLYDKAIAYLRRAIVANPDFALAHFNYGTILMALGRSDEAKREFEEAHRLDPRMTVPEEVKSVTQSR